MSAQEIKKILNNEKTLPIKYANILSNDDFCKEFLSKNQIVYSYDVFEGQNKKVLVAIDLISYNIDEQGLYRYQSYSCDVNNTDDLYKIVKKLNNHKYLEVSPTEFFKLEHSVNKISKDWICALMDDNKNINLNELLHIENSTNLFYPGCNNADVSLTEKQDR